MIQKLIIILIAILFAHTAATAQDWVSTGGPGGASEITFNSRKDMFISANIPIRSTDKGASWKKIGPLGIGGGRIFIAPNDNIFLLSTYNDSLGYITHLWKSTDNGDSWKLLLTRDIQLMVGNDNSLFAEGSLFSDTLYFLHSIDGGKNWDSAAFFSGNSVGRASLDSNGVLILGSIGRVFRSTDHGKSWSEVIKNLSNLNWVATVCGHGGNIFMTSQNPDTSYFSSDDGATWNYMPMGSGLFSVSPSGRILYIGDGILKYSDDGGKTWKDFGGIDQIITDITPFSLDNHLIHDADSGFYYTTIGRTFHANHPGPLPWNLVSVPTSADYSLISHPSGYTFTAANSIWRYDSTRNNWQIMAGRGSEYSKFAIDTNKNLLLADYNNIYRSSDTGKTWNVIWNDPSNNIDIFSLVVLPNNTIIGGSDVDGLIRSTDNGSSWRKVMGIKSIDSNAIYSLYVSSFGDVYAGGLHEIFRSTDYGLTWQTLKIDNFTNQASITSIAVDIFNNIFIFMSTVNKIYRSVDKGRSWSMFSEGISNRFVRDFLSTPSGFVFAATDSGIYQHLPEACEWIPYSTGLMVPDIRCFTIDKNGKIFAGSYGSGIFKSTDSFNTSYGTGILYTEDINFGTLHFGDSDCKNITLKNGGNASFIITSFTVEDPTPFSVADESAKKLPVTLNPNDSLIMSICFHPHQPAVYTSSIIWHTDIDPSLCTGISTISSLSGVALDKKSFVDISHLTFSFSIHPNPLHSKAEIDFSLAKRTYLRIECLDILGRPVKTLADGNFDAGDHTLACDLSELADGVYVVRMISDGSEELRDVVVYH